MLVNLKNMIEQAKLGKYAIPQFNINNLEWAKYILEKSQELNSPVVLGVSEGAARHIGGYKTVVNMIEGLLIDLNITIDVCIHLDHSSSFETCKEAIDKGFTSVMIDASKRSLSQNIETTKQVVEYAKDKDVTVEAEIGGIGDSNLNEIKEADVEECIKLVDETNIDLLAPALGSVHGLYKGKPNINFNKMNEISIKTNIPLVLHGGTGILDDQILKAIENGTTKININTELQIEWANAVKEYIKNHPEVYDPRKIIGSGENEIKMVVERKINLFKR